MSDFYIRLTVSDLGRVFVNLVKDGKTVLYTDSYTFERIMEQYQDSKKELLEVPELKKFIERS